MNKKFSTLVAVGLLASGALLNSVDAKNYTAAEFAAIVKDKVLTLPEGEEDLVVNLTENASVEGGYLVINTPGITLTAEVNKTFTGRLVIAAEGVTIRNLKITNAPVAEDANGYWTKTAITAFADNVTVTSNVINATIGDVNSLANGVVLYPQSSAVNYKIEGNTFTGLSKLIETWYCTAIQIYQGAVTEGKTGDPIQALIDAGTIDAPKFYATKAKNEAVPTATLKNFNGSSLANNTFTGSDADIVIRYGNEYKDGKVNPDYKVDFAQITKPAAEKASLRNTALDHFQTALLDAVANSAKDGSSSLIVEGATATEVADAIATIAKDNGNAKAEALSKANILIETKGADGKSTGSVVMGTVANAPADAVEVEVKTDGTTVVKAPLASTATSMSTGVYYVFMSNEDNRKAINDDFTAATYPTDGTGTHFIWMIDETIKGDGDAIFATLKAKDGCFLKSGGDKVAIKLKKNADGQLVPYTGVDVLSFAKVTALGTPVTISGNTFTLVNAPANTLVTSTVLKQYYGASFETSIKWDDKVLEANPFVGQITPVASTSDALDSYLSTAAYALQNADGNYIVVDTKEQYAVGAGNTYGYKLTTLTGKQLRAALADDDTKNRYAFRFSVYAYDGFSAGDNQVARIEVMSADDNIYELGALTVNKVNYLSAEKKGTNFQNDINVKLGHFNVVNVKELLGSNPGFYTVTAKHVKKDADLYGKVLGLNAAGKVGYVKANEALAGYPETQFAITYDSNTKVLTLKNREQPTATATSGAAYTLDSKILYNIPGKTNVYAINGDTIEIAKITDYKEADGYLRLNADELKDQSYYVGVYSPVWKGNAWMVENHSASHQIGLDTDKANATEWKLTPAMSHELDIDNEVVSVTPDTIEIKSILGYFDGNDYKETKKKVDGVYEGTTILKFPAYNLMNTANGEYVAYETSKYVTGEASKKIGYVDAEKADYFALKMVGDDKYNMVTVGKNVNTEADEYVTAKDPITSLSDKKVYGGDSADKGILNQEDMYAQTENDVFTVEMKAAPEYRKIAMGDTIKIFRNESTDEAQVLFEKGEFLSIANAVQFPEINPALYVDTAFVNREHNNRWEYLLAVNAKHWDKNEDCGVEDHPKHQADTTTGRFLVNLMDSAYVYGETHLHNNKFINEEDGEDWAKLAFVEGYHTHDTLYLKRPNGTYHAMAMDRKDYDHGMAKFAFRIVDQNTQSFVIETGRKNWNGGEAVSTVQTGYLKWLNGVVVVVKDIKNADVFNLNADENRTPTTNEGVSASEVSIIAGNGSVVVKGAAGKSVAISNILGQTIVNTVLTSDNATIAVPAGIVVVAVEGEEAVKTVVK